MRLPTLSMGCLSSRSTIVPSERVNNETTTTTTATTTTGQKSTRQQNGKEKTLLNGNNSTLRSPMNDLNSRGDGKNVNNYKSPETGNTTRQESVNSGYSGDDIMSILMNDQDKRMDGGGENGGVGGGGRGGGGGVGGMSSLDDRYKGLRARGMPESSGRTGGNLGLGLGLGLDSNGRRRNDPISGELELQTDQSSLDGGDMGPQHEQAAMEGKSNLINPNIIDVGSFDEEPNMDLLRQYVAIDYEITQLEDKDALRIYHEKIEQLEELERELDMIRTEAEEVANQSETGTTQSEMVGGEGVGGNHSVANGPLPGNGESKDMENNSIISGSIKNNNNHRNRANSNNRKNLSASQSNDPLGGSQKDLNLNNTTINSNNNSNYSTVEEVFNRKIILEKERDKLKKEVEMVIIECDKLQQRYKKRDEILDKLFDGRTGNGLENHLEQQLNWLLEQKHYVDQVFYAWKRAETLNSQTCEQFTNALELLKQLPKIEDQDERSELIKSIGDLLIKSRQDIEQAQQYNPNVDAPFFTDNETERFDTIIEQISTNSINQKEYSQVLTVIQFAYKRAVNIRLWLEQILQTTIARDSFELAEEYKWIAIQLRKERINLIKAKLQQPAYKQMVQSIQEQVNRQQTMSAERRQHEINRDSGIESETNDIDIEEEIYRLLEMNRSRLAITSGANNNAQQPGGTGSAAGLGAAGSSATQKMEVTRMSHNTLAGAKLTSSIRASSNNINQNEQQQLRVTQGQVVVQHGSGSTMLSSNEMNKDKRMHQRIQKRVKGDQPLLTAKIALPLLAAGSVQPTPSASTVNHQPAAHQDKQSPAAGEGLSNDAMSHSIGTPTRLKIELDEEAKQSLLKQVDQIHMQHKSRIERLRGNNRAKAADSIMSRMQQLRENQKPEERILT